MMEIFSSPGRRFPAMPKSPSEWRRVDMYGIRHAQSGLQTERES